MNDNRSASKAHHCPTWEDPAGCQCPSARPVVDREALLVAMGQADGAHNTRAREVRAYAYETLYGRFADAVLALFPTAPQPAVDRVALEKALRAVLAQQGVDEFHDLQPLGWKLADAVIDLLNGSAV